MRRGKAETHDPQTRRSHRGNRPIRQPQSTLLRRGHGRVPVRIDRVQIPFQGRLQQIPHVPYHEVHER